MDPIRVLHFIPGFSYGGIESRFLDWYELIDKSEVQFDLLIQTNENNIIFKNFKEQGGKVFKIPPISSINSIQEHIKFLKKLFSENNYSAVHCHSADKSYFVLKEAKKANINIRVLHARTSSLGGGGNLFVKSIFKLISPSKATDFFAVSETAGKWLFGNKNMHKVKIIKNGVFSEKFIFSEETRNKIRTEYKINNEDLVIGHVGRFTYAKNHLFLIDVFKDITTYHKYAKLILIGDGPNMEEVKSKVNDLGINDNVIFIGYCNQPEHFYQAMDVFLFPSYYEGLPGSLIEAQISDLFCVISDTITKEAILLDSTKSLSLKKSPQEWSQVIINSNLKKERLNKGSYATRKGYDLNGVVNYLQNFYLGKNNNE